MKNCYLVVFSLLFSTPALGMECGSPSPYGHKPESYFSTLKQKSITKKEFKEVEGILKKMDDHWKGEGISIECKSPDGALKKFKEKLEIEARIDFDTQSVLQINQRVRTKDRGKEFTENLKLYLGKYYLRAGSNHKNSHVGFLDSNKKRLGFLVRVSNASSLSGGRTVIDNYTVYEVSRNKLTIKITSYVNGLFFFVSENEWRLKPR